MLIASGPGVYNLQDYTSATQKESISIDTTQGDTLPTAKLQIWDPLGKATIVDEDDIVILDEVSPSGWPTLNLLQNPSFQGTYTNGIAPSWGKGTTAASGVTYSLYPTMTPFSPTSPVVTQRMLVSNAPGATTVAQITQRVSLPTNEIQVPIRSMPYYGSAWFLVRSAPTNLVTFTISIQWLTSSSSLISTTPSQDMTSSVTPGTWQCFSVSGKAPSNAVYAVVSFQVGVSSSTNSVDVIFSGAQFECATFGNFQSTNFPVIIQNSAMMSTGTSGVADFWVPQNASYASYTASSHPAYYTKSQKLTVTSVPSGQLSGIGQSAIPYNPYSNQLVTVGFQFTSTSAHAIVFAVAVDFYTATGVLINTVQTAIPPSSVPINTWNVTSVSIGPGTGNVALSSLCTNIAIRVGILALSSYVGSDSVSIGYVTHGNPYGSSSRATDVLYSSGISTANYYTSASQVPNATQTAIQAGMYPTPIVVPSGTDVYFDMDSSSCYYRQRRLFGGYIKVASYDYTNSPERTVDIDATGYGILLQESPANVTIENQQDSDAIASLFVEDRAQGFLKGVDYTTYVSSLQIINSLTFNWQTVKDVLSQIANLTVAAYWVDAYKALHYIAVGANTAPYAFSDVPDPSTNTYPFTSFKYDNDSTQSVTEKVFEGGTVISLPVSQSFHGTSIVLNQTVTSGNTYTALTVNALSATADAGTLLLLTDGTNSQQCVLYATATSGATSVTLVSFIASDTFASGSHLYGNGFEVNGGSPIYQLTSCTVNGVAQSVGISGVNTFVEGYQALVDVNTAQVTFTTYPPSGQVVTIIYTYQAPVIVRLRNNGAETIYGSIRRRIHHHQQDSTITSYATAISRSSSELKQYSSPQALGHLTVYSPPAPPGVHLTAGMAVPVTFASTGLYGDLFQIQTMKVTSLGMGVLKYACDIGYYRPDLVAIIAQGRRGFTASTDVTQTSTLSDVLAVQDEWTFTDALSPAVPENVGTWGPTTSSTWNGTYVWG